MPTLTYAALKPTLSRFSENATAYPTGHSRLRARFCRKTRQKSKPIREDTLNQALPGASTALALPHLTRWKYVTPRTHYYLRVTHDATLGKVPGLVLTDDGAYDEVATSQVAIGDWPQCWLRADIDQERLQFHASPDGRKWQPVGPALDASRLSDDYGQGLHFTGAFVGLCAQDLGGIRTAADFAHFSLSGSP